MSDDPADLSHLADIVVPTPVPWWPPAPGWWIIAAAALAAIALLVCIAICRYRQNAYRRAALVELAAIDAAESTGSAVAISAILKRAALVAYPRSEVASLTGSAWLAFLDRTGATDDFSQGPAAAAMRAPLGDGATMLAAARRWVKRHREDG